MKKQILVLVLLVMAVFAGVNKSYGQATPASSPIPLVCSDDALHPVAGKTYPYQVSGTGSDYTWWATQDPDFIKLVGTVPTSNLTSKLTVASGDLISTGGNYGVKTAAASSVDIKWSSDILSKTIYNTPSGTKKPTYVVVLNEDACTNNLKVYQLDPKNGFTVDILNVKQDKSLINDYTTTVLTCFSSIASAKYNGTGIDFNYGTNILYYEVVAANFSSFWTGSFKVAGLNAGQTATIEWTYNKTLPAGAAGYNSLGTLNADGTFATTAKVLVDATTSTDAGVSIFLRVTITNGKWEGIADEPISIKVNGFNAVGEEDVNNLTCLVPATNFEDVATQTLTKRPKITPVTLGSPAPNTTLVPAN